MKKFVYISIALMLLASRPVNAGECLNINGQSIDKNSNMRPFVCFEHDSHNEKAAIEDCARCHHVYDDNEKIVDGESSEDKSCAECHAGNKDSGSADKLDMNLIKKYHKLCRDCHLEQEKGPVVCGGCHKK